MSLEERQKRIAEEAFYRAERRGFAPGGELEDWLEAERALTLSSLGAETDSAAPTPAGPESGIPLPSPLAEEDAVEADEATQSAEQLAGKARDAGERTGTVSKKTSRPSSSPRGGARRRLSD